MSVTINEALSKLSVQQQLDRYKAAYDSLQKYDGSYVRKLGDKSQADIRSIMDTAEIILQQDITAYSKTSRFIHLSGLYVKIEQCQKDIILVDKMETIPELQMVREAQKSFNKADKNLQAAKTALRDSVHDDNAYLTAKRLNLI